MLSFCGRFSYFVLPLQHGLPSAVRHGTGHPPYSSVMLYKPQCPRRAGKGSKRRCCHVPCCPPVVTLPVLLQFRDAGYSCSPRLALFGFACTRVSVFGRSSACFTWVCVILNLRGAGGPFVTSGQPLHPRSWLQVTKPGGNSLLRDPDGS